MKKTYNINLGGTPFTIDEDAYELLTQYFDTISKVCADTDDSAELLADIETRAAELLLSRAATPQTIVTLPMAEAVIAQIGRPDDFEEVSVSPDRVTVEDIRVTPPPFPGTEHPVQKRLFRDPDNKMLGGVCSGLAAYLGIDPTWVRLATVALCFLSFSTAALVYVILWIVLPEAITPVQRMQMYGETPTFDNIGKTVTGMFRSDSTTPPAAPGFQRQRQSGFGYTLSKICAVLAKVILVGIGLICVPVVFGLGVAFIAMTVALVVSLFGGMAWIAESWMPVEGFNIFMLLGIGACLSIGIPIGLLIWLIIGGGSHRTLSRGWQSTLAITWVIGLTLAIASTMIAKVTGVYSQWEDVIERIEDADDDNDRTLEVVSAAEAVTDSAEVVSESMETVGDTLEAVSDSLVVEKNGNTVTITDQGVEVKRPGKRSVQIGHR